MEGHRLVNVPVNGIRMPLMEVSALSIEASSEGVERSAAGDASTSLLDLGSGSNCVHLNWALGVLRCVDRSGLCCAGLMFGRGGKGVSGCTARGCEARTYHVGAALLGASCAFAWVSAGLATAV
jgi:hypothetical protein